MSEWVSVKERLPELGEYVLVRFYDGANRDRGLGMHVMELVIQDFTPYWENFDSNYNFSFDTVTHWQPLPAPPQPEVIVGM